MGAQEIEDTFHEEEAVRQTKFAGREIAQFRELFRNTVKQKEGWISFQELKRMLDRVLCFEPGDKLILRYTFLENVATAPPDTEAVADFPSFLLIMRKLIDGNFANIASQCNLSSSEKDSS